GGRQFQHHRSIPPAHPSLGRRNASAGLRRPPARKPAAQPLLRLGTLRAEAGSPYRRGRPFPDDARRAAPLAGDSDSEGEAGPTLLFSSDYGLSTVNLNGPASAAACATASLTSSSGNSVTAQCRRSSS